MSFIHQALRKAQRDRDAACARPVAGGPAAPRRPHPSRRRALAAIAILFLLAGLAFGSRSWFDLRKLRASSPVAENPPAAPEPVSRSAAGPAAEALYQRARQSHRDGNFAEARQGYEAALAADPGHAAALNNLGVLLLRTGDFGRAEGRFRRAIQLNPRAADPYYNLACLNSLRGELDRSLAFLQRAAELEPAVIEWSREDPDLEGLRGLPEYALRAGKEPGSGSIPEGPGSPERKGLK